MVWKNLFNKTEALPFLLFFLNFFLKFIYLDSQDICVDEPYTIYHAQFSLPDIVSFLSITNNPPLYEIILHYWIKLFGISAISVRFLPLLFSSLTVVFIYKIGKSIFNSTIAITSSLLFTFSTYNVFYAHDCRAYPLFLLLTTISFYLFIKLIFVENKRHLIYYFIAVNVLLIYSHYFGFIVWFAQFIYLIIYKRKEILKFTLAYLLGLLFYVPQLFSFLNRTHYSATNGTWIKDVINMESLYNKLVLFNNMPIVAVAGILIMIIYFAKKTFIKPADNTSSKKNANVIVVMWFFLPFLMLFLMSFKLPMFLDRYLIFITPAYYLMISYMLYELVPSSSVSKLLMSGLVLGFIFTLNLNPTKKREIVSTVDFISKKMNPDAMVIISPIDFMTNFVYYYDRKMFSDIGKGDEYGGLTESLIKQRVYVVSAIEEIPKDALNKYTTIIYLDAAADFINPNNNIYNFLSSNRTEKQKTHFENIFNVYEFEKLN